MERCREVGILVGIRILPRDDLVSATDVVCTDPGLSTPAYLGIPYMVLAAYTWSTGDRDARVLYTGYTASGIHHGISGISVLPMTSPDPDT